MELIFEHFITSLLCLFLMLVPILHPLHIGVVLLNMHVSRVLFLI